MVLSRNRLDHPIGFSAKIGPNGYLWVIQFVTVKRFQFEALIFRRAFGILVSLSSADRAVHSQMRTMVLEYLPTKLDDFWVFFM